MRSNLEANNCEGCQFWDSTYSAEHRNKLDQGEKKKAVFADCRRSSPQVVGDRGVSAWPKTESLDWCGEWVDERGEPSAEAQE